MPDALPAFPVTQTGQVADAARHEIPVALTCLRPGPDTRAARHCRDLFVERGGLTDPGLLEALADRLEIPLSDRAARVSRAREYARRALSAARERGIGVLPLGDAAYPPWLTHIIDPPTVLWTRGDAAHFSRPAVAVVGSRAATPTGLLMAGRLARELAAAGLTVVSGLARGIDAEAHKAALDEGGVTVAVLGSGVDHIYPREHAPLAARVQERGVVVSELLPGTPPDAHHFPRRNRIISGLSVATVVVEASERSGSLITARAALDQGRDVLAVPGNPASGRYRGCHALIKNGARLVETVEDVLEEIGWVRFRQSAPQPACNSLKTHRLAAAMAIGEPYTVDDLSERTGLAARDVIADLGALELSGLVRRVSGGGYVRLD
jgi:DNA processing protein